MRGVRKGERSPVGRVRLRSNRLTKVCLVLISGVRMERVDVARRTERVVSHAQAVAAIGTSCADLDPRLSKYQIDVDGNGWSGRFHRRVIPRSTRREANDG